MKRVAVESGDLATLEASTRAVPARSEASRDERLRAAVRAHHASIWRILRRFGVPAEAADDAASQVFSVYARRLDDVAPEKEKAFLSGVAARVAQSIRRDPRRHRETSDEEILASLPSTDADPEALLDAHRARALLDGILEAIPQDLRTVFVLYEIEEMTMIEIAASLDLPAGTVASRLRRARELFERLSRRAEAQLASTRRGR